MCGAVSLLRVVSGVNRLGGVPVVRAREETSLPGSGSTYRALRVSLSQRVRLWETGPVSRRRDQGRWGGRACGAQRETPPFGCHFCYRLVIPNYSAVGAARGFFSIIGGGLLTRKGVVRSQCGRLREKRRAPCDGKSRPHTRVAGGSKSLQVTRSITLTEPTLRVLHPFGRSASKIAWVFRTFMVGASHVPVVVEIEESIRT
ncbi:hypothetical protein TNCT_549251 [Trichonephila clavata]|uniref:Uncharacterized protein n=1 Tax=Trichonephila clavata TaxID=2740835 RepID=A0A8X6KDA5_TRICU|nr:hypothetical protein TNCT_549251 [Trichonephila clavata]